jgi:hypothetical protein
MESAYEPYNTYEKTPMSLIAPMEAVYDSDNTYGKPPMTPLMKAPLTLATYMESRLSPDLITPMESRLRHDKSHKLP